MPGVRSIAMKSIRTTISIRKEIGAEPPGAPFPKIFIIHPRKKN